VTDNSSAARRRIGCGGGAELVCGFSCRIYSAGDAENARHEIAGHENAAPECKGGKCET